MKHVYNRDNRLESHPYFGYVAWTVVIGFALFVYWMTVNISERIAAIEARTAAIENEYLVSVEKIDLQDRQ